IAHQHGLVVVLQIEHPVVAPGDSGEDPAEPVVEADPELVGAPRLLGHGLAARLDPFALAGPAAIGHGDAAVLLQAVMRLGLGAVALEEHRQASQLVPGALVALQVDGAGGGRRLGDGGGGTAGQSQQQGDGEVTRAHHFRPWPENIMTLSAANCTLMKLLSSPQVQLVRPMAPEHSVGLPSRLSTSLLAMPALSLA